ncbi:YcaO-like family protein [Rhizobium sp. SGZ-381]|uniref:YcaO-like family protein n=1 Tax=Rhizobium sp. SGZ-381 TaxID=3342800 RepID=UPI0036734BCA
MPTERTPVAELNANGAPDLSATLLDDPELLRRFGITRVGDVTDLDVIGVPVWFAVRPNSRGLSVAQGKGLSVGQAKLSAVMEAIEGAVAEETGRHIAEQGTPEALVARGLCPVPLERIARVNPDHFDAGRARAWVKGFSVRDNRAVYAPYELVGMDFRADFPWDRQAFQMTSHGLAAGFDEDRVVLHALLELVEHDACVLIDTFESRALGMRPLSVSPGQFQPLDGLLARLESLKLQVRFFDLTGATGVPVILAGIERPLMSDHGPGQRHSAGIACRLDPLEAALAALLEAIQSRLTDISGARDDLSPERYRPDFSARFSNVATAGKGVGFPPKLDLSAGGGQGPVWRRLARHLFDVGIRDLYVFPLDTGTPGIHVARVLADGLSAGNAGLNRLSLNTLSGFLKS